MYFGDNIYKNFKLKIKIPPKNFLPFSYVEILQNTCVYEHLMKELPSQKTQ